MSQPRVLLLHGNSGKYSARDRPQQALTENSCESWVFAFDGDFVCSFDAKPSDLLGYDIIIANTDSYALERLLKLSEGRPATSKWVTLLEGDAYDYAKPRPIIQQLLDSSDLVNCINKHCEGYFKQLTSAKVQYIGFPYPAEGIRAQSTPFDKRRKEIFLAPMLLSRSIEYVTVKNLGIPFYGYERKLTRKLGTIVKNLRKHQSLDRHYFQKKARSLYGDPSLDVKREEPLEGFFNRNSQASVWLNMDHRFTWGRYVLDAAALQIPIIATRSTGHAETFFPNTMIDHAFDVETAITLLKRLFNDRDFYEEVATIPIEAFDEFRHEVKKQQMLDALYSS